MKAGARRTAEQQAAAEGGSVLFQRDFLNAMRVLGLEDNDRCMMLKQCSSFYEGTQHDHHGSDWTGIPRDPGVGYMHERLRPQGFVPVNSVPHAYRKPDAPVPLGRQVVSRFTEMLTGEGRRPALRCWSSVETQDFLEAAFKCASLWDVLSQARDIAGSCGSSAIVLGLTGGYIEAEVLHPKDCWVAEWCNDHPGWMPKVVVHQVRVEKVTMEVDDDQSGLPPQHQRKEKGRLVTKQYWRTRAWTDEHVIYYEDVPCDDVPEDGIPVAADGVKEHGFGSCPVVWHQNTRRTDCPDGDPDCAGAFPLLDKLDRLQSQVYKAAIANVDPSLVIKQTRQARRRNNVIQKGSSGVIGLDPEGEAKYLEMQGTSVEVGLKGIERMTMTVLQTVECVVIHPDTAKAYQSGEALQILWRSMESKANRLRVTLGHTIQEIGYKLLAAAKHHGVANSEKVGTDEDAKGILLPPRRVVEDPEDDLPEDMDPEERAQAMLTAPAEPEVKFEAHKPGPPNTYVDLEWPPYWTPTAAQVAQMAQGLSVASTQKQVISAETAIRTFAQMLGNDGDEEVRRVAIEKAKGQKSFLDGLGDLAGWGMDEDDDDAAFPEPAEPPEDDEDDDEGATPDDDDEAAQSGS